VVVTPGGATKFGAIAANFVVPTARRSRQTPVWRIGVYAERPLGSRSNSWRGYKI
ncbi:MAG: hypothetical protein ACJATA_001694, partial [Sphingobacteriales bacterium]